MHFCAGSLPPWAADLKSGPWKARPDPAVVQGAQVQVQGGAVACLHLQPPARAAPSQTCTCRPDPTEPACCRISGLMQLQALFCAGFFPHRLIIIDLRVGHLLPG